METTNSKSGTNHYDWPIRNRKQQLGSSAFINNLGQVDKLFPSSALTPSVRPLGLISTFATIGMLDLGWTLARTPSVKKALLYIIYIFHVYD